MKKIFLLILSVCLWMLPVQADQTLTTVPASVEDDYSNCVRDYMELSNMRQTFVYTLGATYSQMKEQLQMTDAECMEMAEGMTAWIFDDIVELCIPIYKKYYTLKDMQTLCDFMRTPTGKKFAASSAQVSTEMMGAVAALQSKMQEFVVSYLQNKTKK